MIAPVARRPARGPSRPPRRRAARGRARGTRSAPRARPACGCCAATRRRRTVNAAGISPTCGSPVKMFTVRIVSAHTTVRSDSRQSPIIPGVWPGKATTSKSPIRSPSLRRRATGCLSFHHAAEELVHDAVRVRRRHRRLALQRIRVCRRRPHRRAPLLGHRVHRPGMVAVGVGDEDRGQAAPCDLAQDPPPRVTRGRVDHDRALVGLEEVDVERVGWKTARACAGPVPAPSRRATLYRARARAREDGVHHRLGELAGERVLLAGVKAPDQRVRTDLRLRPVPEPRLRARHLDAGGAAARPALRPRRSFPARRSRAPPPAAAAPAPDTAGRCRARPASAGSRAARSARPPRCTRPSSLSPSPGCVDVGWFA